MKHFRKSFLSVLLVLLLAAAAMTGCANTETPASSGTGTASASGSTSQTDASVSTADTANSTESAESTGAEAGQPVEMGEGDKLFYFNVTFSNGETSSYAIHTDLETVGDALVQLDLISGEEGQYGLYVKTVAGETLDYDADGSYWALYEGDTYATNGVDSTNITDGATYAFVATKG